MKFPRRHLRVKNMSIGIVGYGYVGKATSVLGCKGESVQGGQVQVLVHDINPVTSFFGLNSEYTENISDLSNCNLIFVCVPTPANEDGSCCTKIVEDVIAKLKTEAEGVPIVVRSTVPVGFCQEHGVNFMPEFLTEKNWKNDFRDNQDWVVGAFDNENVNFKELIRNVFKVAHKEKRLTKAPIIHFVHTNAAELCKYGRNCFLATKVSFFNELNGFCEAKSVNYDIVKELICLDERVGESHTGVPGHDGKYGFGGTCFPKDMNSLYAQMEEAGAKSFVVDGAIMRNLHLDRPEQEWKEDKGRAVV